MSRRSVPPDIMLPLDFGPPAVAMVAVVEAAPAPALELIVSSVDENDQRLIDMWLHDKSQNTRRAYKRVAEHFIAFVGMSLARFPGHTYSVRRRAGDEV